MIRRHLNYANVLATSALPRRRLIVTLALLAPLACLGVVSPSSGSEHRPTGGFAPFADCPLADPPVNECVFGQEGSGEFVLGRRTVPLDRPLTLQGGFFGAGEEVTFVGAEDGDTLSKTPLSVPGGLAGILAPGDLPASLRTRFDEAAGGGVTGVTMTPELARPASTIKLDTENLFDDTGVVLQLPLRIRLSSPFLGGDCYLGSSADPIVLSFTAGATDPPAPNKSIRGFGGNFEILENFELIVDRGSSLVDNADAVPRATGCGGSFATVVDAAIDAELGLPSPAGRNTAIFDGTIEMGAAEGVRASE